MIRSAVKKLSENDVGATKSHQAGFLIPKVLVRDGLFEILPDSELNPRKKLKFTDPLVGSEFFPMYIYYNSKFFSGTRHEYRLTGVASWIRARGLRSGDSIEITRVGKYDYEIVAIKQQKEPNVLSSETWIALYGEG